METLLQLIVSGLAAGSIYAGLALALVMIYHATGHLNLAQGEMAMFSAYICLWLIVAGLPYWVAFLLTLLFSFLGGLIIERLIVRPFQGAPVLNAVIVFVGLLMFFNGMAHWLFTSDTRAFPSPFPAKPMVVGGVYFGAHELGAIAVTALVMALLYLFFKYSSLGLSMRAAAENPEAARLAGIRVGRMTGLGWGLAAAVGSVSGMMVAPVLFLEPNMMSGVLLYAFAGALAGGIDNPGGAVAGGLFLGLLETLAGAYIPFIGNELKLSLAFVVIVGVLMIKPDGLFGRTVVTRV